MFLAACGLVMAIGLLLLALANDASVHGESGYWLFWVGIATMIIPAACRVVGASVARTERLVVVAMESVALYLAKVEREPTSFSFHDEFAHWRNATNALRSGHLFGYNPIIPATAHYPGLTDVTVGVTRLTGLSVFTSGTIIIGLARFVLCLAVFLLLERLAGARVAGIGTLLYFANPNFLYWSSQFAYESLALPLVFFALWLALRAGEDTRRTGWRIACVGTISAVVITHHVASYALALILAGWVAVALARRRRTSCFVPLGLAAYATGAAVAWLCFVAPSTLSYLGPVLSRALSGAVALVVKRQSSRQLFAGGGQVAPSWEQHLALAAVALLLVGLPFGLLQLRRTTGWHALVVILAAGCLLYVGLLPLRLTAAGQETANRSSEYVFLSLGAVNALAVIQLVGDRLSRLREALGAASLAVILLGGVAVSWAFYERLQPNLSVAGVPTQPTPAATALAEWMAQSLGPYHRVATDSVDQLAMGSYAEQDPVLEAAGERAVPVYEVFFPTTVTARVRRDIQSDRIQYLVTQSLLTTGVSPVGGFFDPGEPVLPGDRLRAASLGKFDTTSGFSRLYDSGGVALYQTGPGT